MPYLKRMLSPPGFTDLDIIRDAIEPRDKPPTSAKEPSLRGIFQARGQRGVAASAFPTLSNPNNVAILSGMFIFLFHLYTLPLLLYEIPGDSSLLTV